MTKEKEGGESEREGEGEQVERRSGRWRNQVGGGRGERLGLIGFREAQLREGSHWGGLTMFDVIEKGEEKEREQGGKKRELLREEVARGSLCERKLLGDH